MPRRIVIKDFEEEVERTIKSDNLDRLYTKLILLVDSMAPRIASFNRGGTVNPGRDIRVKLMKIRSLSTDFARIVQRVKRHRINAQKIDS